MGLFTIQRDDSLHKIARIMSEKTGLKVSADNVRVDVSTATTSIYSTVVYDKALGTRSIICKVRKWNRPQKEYEVTSEKLN